MLLSAVCALFFPGVLGTEFLKKNGECPGPGKNPGQPVQSCDYYCKNGTTYYRAYYEVGTKCEYDGQVSMCLPTDDGGVSCYSPDDPIVLSWKEKGSRTTKPPTEKPAQKQKKKKQQSKRNNRTKSSKKSKSKKKKEESTTLSVC
nr:uncharacterized protein LOC129387451 [Dermacentor andersoni]